MLMFPFDLALIAHAERLAWMDTPGGRYSREWLKHDEIDRLKERLSQARQSLKVATAQ
jgi:hypothetical protein